MCKTAIIQSTCQVYNAGGTCWAAAAGMTTTCAARRERLRGRACVLCDREIQIRMRVHAPAYLCVCVCARARALCACECACVAANPVLVADDDVAGADDDAAHRHHAVALPRLQATSRHCTYLASSALGALGASSALGAPLPPHLKQPYMYRGIPLVHSLRRTRTFPHLHGGRALLGGGGEGEDREAVACTGERAGVSSDGARA